MRVIDDTLLASSWIARLGLRPKYMDDIPIIPQETQDDLKALSKAVISLLTLALDYGQVVIVTAAETGWVELSASMFLPDCLPLIQRRIRVVSARSTFESMYPGSPGDWKRLAFAHEVEMQSTPLRHVLSFGDSSSEREALLGIAETHGDIVAKSLKFMTHPNICELRQQIELVIGYLDYMCTHDENLDLELSKQQSR